MDREEYMALCALRDGAYEDAKLAYLALKNRYDGLLVVNSEQLDRLTKLTFEAVHLRTGITCTEDKDRVLTARVKHLEDELIAAKAATTAAEATCAEQVKINQALETLLPMRTNIQQPLFAKANK